jgi:hypothetical protein
MSTKNLLLISNGKVIAITETEGAINVSPEVMMFDTVQEDPSRMFKVGDDFNTAKWEEYNLTTEEKTERAVAVYRTTRDDAVKAITVTVDGNVFEGDEVSQTRMARAIVAMNDGDTIVWKLADNTPASVTMATLKEALRLSGAEQTRIWTS